MIPNNYLHNHEDGPKLAVYTRPEELLDNTIHIMYTLINYDSIQLHKSKYKRFYQTA